MKVTPETTLADMWLDLIKNVPDIHATNMESMALFAGGAVAALYIIRATAQTDQGASVEDTFNRLVNEADQFTKTAMKEILKRNEKNRSDPEQTNRLS